MYKAIIIDDERLSRTELKRALKSQEEFELFEAASYEEAVQLIDAIKPDLIFLDIQLNGKKTGFNVLENINHLPQIIFTTAFDEYAVKAFEKNAIDYLLKPIDNDRLQESIQKCIKNIKATTTSIVNNTNIFLTMDDHVFVKENEHCWFVQLKEITFLERDGNYTRVYFGKNKPLILKSLNNLEERLDVKYFFRANRKQIINVNMIDKVQTSITNNYIIYLKSGDIIELSRRQSIRFKEVMSF
jgi:two-component system, LytTR family, response regulator